MKNSNFNATAQYEQDVEFAVSTEISSLSIVVQYEQDVKSISDLDLHSWLSEWLIEDYQITMEGLWYGQNVNGAFRLTIPFTQIKPSEMNAVLKRTGHRSYLQPKTGSKFKVIA